MGLQPRSYGLGTSFYATKWIKSATRGIAITSAVIALHMSAGHDICNYAPVSQPVLPALKPGASMHNHHCTALFTAAPPPPPPPPLTNHRHYCFRPTDPSTKCSLDLLMRVLFKSAYFLSTQSLSNIEPGGNYLGAAGSPAGAARVSSIKTTTHGQLRGWQCGVWSGAPTGSDQSCRRLWSNETRAPPPPFTPHTHALTLHPPPS
ncbi:hypothetical protein J6590_056767 [Homalodisca vitripennis]|nr:hypothetical protein J6590_056767 [Homalodisca vitripennis]